MISGEKIGELLGSRGGPDRARVKEIIARAMELKGLSLEEVAALLQLREKGAWEEIFAAAGGVKDRIYGRRVVLFAPLYVTNECVNNCQYCGFRRENRAAHRKTLTPEEIEAETRLLLRQGHKRLLLVFGEHPRWGGIDSVEKAVRSVYGARCNGANIRRVNVNLAPLSVEDFQRLKATGIGTYQIFQETYHRPSYRILHPSGPKADYDWRISAFGRAFAGSIDDVGMGVLFGLYDYRFEVLSLLDHIQYLERTYGIGPHTISFPRVKPAPSTPLSLSPPAPVSDFELKEIVSILRLAVPYTGLILSTREGPHLRDELFHLGVSQISAGSRTSPGAYGDEEAEESQSTEQFEVEDRRSLDQVVYDLCRIDYIPSFCTACYRLGRTGQEFMSLAKPGFIQDYCTPNALLTFKEYLLDHASPKTKEIGERVLLRHLGEISKERTRQLTEERLKGMEAGRRDLYF